MADTSTPRIHAFLTYEDPEAAAEWLARAYGFTVGLVLRDDAGRVNHAELRLDEQGRDWIALGPPYEVVRSQSPRALGGASTAHLYVYVDDVDQHCDRAREAGAEIIAPPKDEGHGDRTYRAADLEGHVWRFATRIR
jgi:uncharacterized glyoxalase superfamily protein PhnB